MNRMTAIKRCLFALTVALLSALLASCHVADDTMGLDVVGYNHTDHSIGTFSVNGQGSQFVAAHEAHGMACCVSLPAKYTPGMTVTVTWTDENDEHPQSRVVVVPPFTDKDTGVFAVHFLRNGEIKVFVTDLVFISNPSYPLKGDEAKM